MTQKPKIRPLPMLNICSQQWRDMSGTHLTRHCDQCDKQVHNLSALPQAQALAFVEARRADNICVRYECDDQGDMVFLEHAQPLGHSQPPHSPRGHLSAWALSVGLSLSLLEGTSSADAANTAKPSAAGSSIQGTEERPSKTPSGKLPPISAALSAKYSYLQRPPIPVHLRPVKAAIPRHASWEVAGGLGAYEPRKRIAGEESPLIPEALAQSLAGQEGQIRVQITLDNATGDIKTLTIVHSDLPSLNNLLLEHLKSWKFRPSQPETGERAVIQPFHFNFKSPP